MVRSEATTNPILSLKSLPFFSPGNEIYPISISVVAFHPSSAHSSIGSNYKPNSVSQVVAFLQSGQRDLPYISHRSCFSSSVRRMARLEATTNPILPLKSLPYSSLGNEIGLASVSVVAFILGLISDRIGSNYNLNFTSQIVAFLQSGQRDWPRISLCSCFSSQFGAWLDLLLRKHRKLFSIYKI